MGQRSPRRNTVRRWAKRAGREFYHWYLREIRGGKAAAETACDRFARAYFRDRNRGVDWTSVLPGYALVSRRPLKPAA